MPLANVSITRTTSNNANVIIGYEAAANSSLLTIAVDYTDILLRIATASEQISANLAFIKSYIDNINERGSNQNQGFYVRNIDTADGNLTPTQQRAVIMSALKTSGSLTAVEEEIRNPTQLPG